MLPSATMPRVGPTGTPERDLATRDLAAFLRSDASPPPRGSGETSPPEVAAEGERLWRTLGCFTCHSLPGDALAPAGAPERRSWSASAGKWKRSALVEYLESPGRRDPSTAMPDFRLAPREAAALAAFLELRSPEPEGPAREAASKSAEGDPRRGRELAASLGCASCHEISGVEPRLRAPRLEALGGELDRGCLADRPEPPSRAPDFRFSAGDREALRRLLRGGREWLTQDALPEAAERSIAALRCTACHARDGAADAWSELEPLDGSTALGDRTTDPSEPAGTAPGTIHRTRPSLTWAGEKLRPEWTERLLAGDLPYKPRPHLPSRMPAFPAHARVIAAGLALEHGLEAVTPERGRVDAGLAEIGRAHLPARRFRLRAVPSRARRQGPCWTRHRDHRARADRGTPRRAFLLRFLENPDAYLPGTFMPRYSDDAGRSVIRGVLEGDAHRQFEALWHYLRSIESAR
jgi:cytochrome c2